ncbi:Zinc finger, RING-type [Penicillium digitatum]|uniref:Zinc finger, RING-type n=1 Tax=Penicillium digitatum TaxID=36651 RepID=A0A7T6XJI6_PENDI|nr:Zinc finger, RING-type [Penicillium digitatum]
MLGYYTNFSIAYGRLRPDNESEPFVWQVARATAAAPCLFPTIDIPGLGTFQDGVLMFSFRLERDLRLVASLQ